jgi:predicted transcriptional regulator
MERDDLITLTADIVASHVSHNNVAIGDISNLVQQVHSALAGLSAPANSQEDARQPAVSIRSSIKPDSLTCLMCGKRQKTLKRHLSNAHGMTPAEYRAEFELPNSYPMTAPAYSEQRRDLAKKIGLGRKGRSRKAASKSKART